MDAVRAKEWKMFAVLKDMGEGQAYTIFTLVHLPLYFAVLFIITRGGAQAGVLYYFLDLFVIFHSVIHFAFRKKASNGFTSFFSKILIYGLGFLALIHLALLAGGHNFIIFKY